LVSYHVWNNFPQSRNVTVQLSAINQNDTTSSYYKDQTVAVGACDSSTINWIFAPTKIGYHIVNATENGKFRAGEDFHVVDSNSYPSVNSKVVNSPLKQFRSGISAQDVKCREDLMLITKVSDGSPACVKPLTYNKLALQGWAKIQGVTTTTYVVVNNTQYEIPYVIRGWTNELLYMTFDTEHKSLVVFVKSTAEKGEITLTIPRALLDSNLDQYARFVVVVDGKETKYMETESATARTLTIPFEIGAKKIEIIAPQRI
jgi:hypothetical protein